MTNKNDEKLDFERIRSKFTPCSSSIAKPPLVGTTNGGSLQGLSAGTNEALKRAPPPLFPKPKLIRKNVSETGQTSSSELSVNANNSNFIETTRLDVKETIRLFNKIGSRLFELPDHVENTSSTSGAPSTPSASFYCDTRPKTVPTLANGDAFEDSSSDTSSTTTIGDENDVEKNTEGGKHRTRRKSIASSNDEGVTASARSADIDDASSGIQSLVKDETLHRTILNEMKNNGLFRLLSNGNASKKNCLLPELGKMRETSAIKNYVRSSEPSIFAAESAQNIQHNTSCDSNNYLTTNRAMASNVNASRPPAVSSSSILAHANSFNATSGKTNEAASDINLTASSSASMAMRMTKPTAADDSNDANATTTTRSDDVFMRKHSASFNTRNTFSVESSHSDSTFSDYPDTDLSSIYYTGDEKEDKRLRNLHLIAREFYNVQKSYVDLLNHIGENYPAFLREYSKRSGKALLAPTPAGKPHVVTRISAHFKQILGVHRIFLDDFEEKYRKWDSREPDLASVLQQKAEFLKICNSFLKDKRDLCEEMQQALDDNKDFALATKRFEDNVLNASASSSESASSDCSGSATSLHGISIVMHLDAVHQNIVRYRLLMERYQKYLPPEHVEARIAEEALRKLIAVSNTVNGFLAGADASQRLMPLYPKLAGVFDVFAPGRQLIHEGELQRQTRKDLQLRYLILFSDMLLICRYLPMGTDSFDLMRLYKIPIERVCVQFLDHEDYEKEFVIISPKKSSAFVAKTKRDRDIWVSRITEACRDYRENKRKRRLMAIRKTASSCEESPDVENKAFEVGPSLLPTAATAVGAASVPSSFASKESKPQSYSQRYEALWIPDNKATKCLMLGCDTKFNILRRKHHCRQCGWLICRNCVGYAPVKIKKFERVKVCPECYYNIKTLFEQGHLFPASRIQRVGAADSIMAAGSSSAGQQIDIGEVASPMALVAVGGAAEAPVQDTTVVESLGCVRAALVEIAEMRDESDGGDADAAVAEAGVDCAGAMYSIDDSSLRVVYDGGLRFETPRDLFQAPPNGLLRKTQLPVQKSAEMFLASGKVLLRNRKGVDLIRWARLTKEMFLQFFEAEFDDQPLENYFVYGYTLKTAELESGGCVIELVHRNQFQTDRKEERVIFQVNHAKSAERWLNSLRQCIDAFSE